MGTILTPTHKGIMSSSLPLYYPLVPTQVRNKEDIVGELVCNLITSKLGIVLDYKNGNVTILDSTGETLAPITHVAIVNEEKPLDGKTVCFTGAASIERRYLICLVEIAGGTVHSSVRTNTDYLVVADGASWTSKTRTAKQRGIDVINFSTFHALLQPK